MGQVYELMDEREARTVLKKLQAMWDAERELKAALADHDGTDRCYARCDRAVAAYQHARYRWTRSVAEGGDQEQE